MNEKMKPMIILPEGEMSAENIKLLRDNGICVVESKDPAKVKFMDPIPSMSNRTQMTEAAIKLSRIVLSGQWSKWKNENYIYQSDCARIFYELLTKGTELDINGSVQEQEQMFRDAVKRDEIVRLVREEAKAERAAKKAATTKTTK